jgi:hypothetical protein
MNRDYKQIFESYKVLREQQEQNVYLNQIIKTVNSSKDISADVKQKMITYFTQNAAGLKGAIEAGQNETANVQTGQAPYAKEMPAQDNQSVEDFLGEYPTSPKGPVYDAEGNIVNPEDLGKGE